MTLEELKIAVGKYQSNHPELVCYEIVRNYEEQDVAQIAGYFYDPVTDMISVILWLLYKIDGQLVFKKIV